MREFRYKAFVSYSHKDRKWGQWLFKALEAYRVPKHLVGKTTKTGIVPKHLRPIFRDREELAAADSLSLEIQAALAASEFLIVLCSKNAAISPWVCKEIDEFIRQRGQKNILCLIIDGEPNAETLKDGITEECFPAPLRFDADVAPMFDPIAADIRESADGKKFALLKIISGLIGVGLDEVIRRDLQQKYRRVTAITLAALLGVVAMGLLTYEALDARKEAEQRRADAEGLIEFMLTDLRQKLEPVGRLDVLDAVGEKVVGYYKTQKLQNLSGESLGRRARALHLLGEINHLRDVTETQKKHEQTAAETGALLDKDPENTQRIFDHSQSVYWVAYMQWLRGEYEKTERGWTEYKNMAQKLVDLEPENENWELELAYAHSNLGTLYLQSLGRYEEALKNFTHALKGFQKQVTQKPDDIDAQRDMADAHAWMSDIAMYAGDLESAFQSRQKELAIYQGLLNKYPDNKKIQREIISSWSGLAELNLRAENLSTAVELIRKAWLDGRALIDHDPGNMEWRQQAAFIGMRKTKILLASGQTREAGESLAATDNITRTIDINTIKRRVEIYYQGQLLKAQIIRATGDQRKATKMLHDLRNEMQPYLAREGKNPLFKEIWNVTLP